MLQSNIMDHLLPQFPPIGTPPPKFDCAAEVGRNCRIPVRATLRGDGPRGANEITPAVLSNASPIPTGFKPQILDSHFSSTCGGT
jgi:hypothetical protein